MKPVTVIIPVYNAFDVTRDCIEAVLRTIPVGVRVCAIDDASPEGDLRTFLSSDIKQDPRLKLLRNEKNLGFVGTCNRGMLIESADDVILLNSDTIVTPRWIEKLQRAAYSRPNVGTVTPLTNNGTICSVPRFLENNEVPPGFTLDEFAQLVEDLAPRIYVETPTCVGFCTYIRRAALDEVGVFDPVFSKGYGEENDLSLRLSARGFANIIDDSTYIFHRGNMSFKEMREALSAVNTKILNDRYPSYEESVAKFCSANPLTLAHDRLWHTLIKKFVAKRTRTVLHILHNGPFLARKHALGGTEYHVQALIHNDRTCAHFSLTPADGFLFLTAHLDAGDKTLMLPMALLAEILSPQFFDGVHLHHALGFDRKQLVDSLINHGSYVVSIHDYHLICGRLWLVSPDSGVCDGVECGGSCGESADVGAERRALASKVLGNAASIIAFSESSKDILERVFGRFEQLSVSRHGIEPVSRHRLPIPARPSSTEPLKVLCVGTFVPHKGSEVIKKFAAEIKSVNGVQVEWHFLGRGAENVSELIGHGPYTPQDLREKILESGAHVALLAPQCQETYSITLDELLWSGLPVISCPFGALPERVQKWGVGYVFDNSVEGLVSVLKFIVESWEQHVAKFVSTQTAPIRTVSDEVAECASRYISLFSPYQGGVENLMRFLQPDVYPIELQIVPPESERKPSVFFSPLRRFVSTLRRELHRSPT